MDYVQPAINSMQSVIDYMKPAIDYAQPVIDSGKKFAKDSIRLLNKCTKPDRKGLFYLISSLFVFRVSKDCVRHNDWICGYGLYRFHCESHPHSDSQHYV
jgi:hypothetical protein